MKKVFIKKQIKLIEKKIKILKSELDHFEYQKSQAEKQLNLLRQELINEKQKVQDNPDLGFSFSAYYDANREKQVEVVNKIQLLDARISELKGLLVRQNIELKKYEKLQAIELERERKIEEAIETKELDEFSLRKKNAVGE